MRVSAKRWLARGKASNYIKQANIKPGDKVVLVCRVSGIEQERRKNPADQEADLRRQVEQAGGIVVDSLQIQVSGIQPFWLWRAAITAREHGASLLAETTDRFIRHPAFDSDNNKTAQARTSDLEELALCTDGVQLLTMVKPDASPGKVRSYHTKRGQRVKKAKGGRPKTPEHVRLRKAILKKLKELPR